MVGLTHNAAIIVWEDGGAASDGMGMMAETGNTATPSDEINTAVGEGNGGELILAGGFHAPSPGTAQGQWALPYRC